MAPAERTYIPESEFGKVFWRARIYLLIYLAVIALATATRSILPLLFIGLPTLYGTWLMVVYGGTQHAGLAENVLDHRLNTRTVYMNPVNRYLYWNMGYHVEHHMFPMVPYYNLPKLHALMRADVPPPYNGYGARSVKELYYDEYFRELARNHANFSFQVALSEPRPEDQWMGHTGFIHEVLRREYLAAHVDPTQIEYYLCGPLPMIRAATKMLADFKVPPEQIVSDEF